jgi:hypothetical protein
VFLRVSASSLATRSSSVGPLPFVSLLDGTARTVTEADTPNPKVRRLDTADKARSALRIPTGPPDDPVEPEGLDPSARLEWQVMQMSGADTPLGGIPHSGIRVAYPIRDPDEPGLLAEFAGNLILHRKGKQLVERKPGNPLPWKQRGERRWFYFGTIVREDLGAPAIGSLAVYPWPNASGAGFRGITREVLRAISPTGILRAATEFQVARRAPELDDPIGHPGQAAMRFERVIEGTPRRGRPPSVTDQQLNAYTHHYLSHVKQEAGWIHQRLAEELGLLGGAAESREWRRRARDRGFITESEPGRAGGKAGPRLEPIEPKEDDDA